MDRPSSRPAWAAGWPASSSPRPSPRPAAWARSASSRPATCASEIAAARRLSDRPLAVNLLLPFARRAHFEAASEADVVVTFWGTPEAPDREDLDPPVRARSRRRWRPARPAPTR